MNLCVQVFWLVCLYVSGLIPCSHNIPKENISCSLKDVNLIACKETHCKSFVVFMVAEIQPAFPVSEFGWRQKSSYYCAQRLQMQIEEHTVIVRCWLSVHMLCFLVRHTADIWVCHRVSRVHIVSCCVSLSFFISVRSSRSFTLCPFFNGILSFSFYQSPSLFQPFCCSL